MMISKYTAALLCSFFHSQADAQGPGNETQAELTPPKIDLNTNFVVENTALNCMKDDLPFIQDHQEDPSHDEFVIDIVSIGSQTRPQYLKGQIDTWAKHKSIRHYWGFSEATDYDKKCDAMSDDDLAAHVHACKYSSFGWEPYIERFTTKYYGIVEGGGTRYDQAGWICAQRRPGRTFGWIYAQYHGDKISEIPDFLSECFCSNLIA